MFKVVSFSCIFILYEFKSMPSRGNGVILIGLFSLLVIVMSCRKHQMYYFDEAQLHDYSNSRSIVINCTLTKGQNIVWNCCISLLKTVVLTHQSETSIPRFYFKMRCKNLPIWRRLQTWFLLCQSIWGPDIKQINIISCQLLFTFRRRFTHMNKAPAEGTQDLILVKSEVAYYHFTHTIYNFIHLWNVTMHI